MVTLLTAPRIRSVSFWIRYILIIAVVGVYILPRTVLPAQNDRYAQAYDRWVAAVDRYALDVGSWFDAEHAPLDLRAAIQGLLDCGPNMAPYVVEKLRAETNESRRLQLCEMLLHIAGIVIIPASIHVDLAEGVRVEVPLFLKEWDAGGYNNASDTLRRRGLYGNEVTPPVKVDYNRLMPIRRYGIYALPFILEELNRGRSAEMYAAYLAITGQLDAYTAYYKNPGHNAQQEQLQAIRTWFENNKSRLNELPVLYSTLSARLEK